MEPRVIRHGEDRRIANPANAGQPPMPTICTVPKRRNQDPRSASFVRSASVIGAARLNAPQPNPKRNPGIATNTLARHSASGKFRWERASKLK
jgi:hypothetical protein